MGTVGFVGALIFVLLIIVFNSIKIVTEYERVVVFTLGRYSGIAFYIQSPHTDSSTLISAMNDFIGRAADYVKALPEEHWQHLQFGLASQLQEKDTNLRIKSQRYWAAICNKEASFTQKHQLIETIKSLSITDIINFIQQHFHGEITDDRLSLLSYENNDQFEAMVKNLPATDNSELLLKKCQRKY